VKTKRICVRLEDGTLLDTRVRRDLRLRRLQWRFIKWLQRVRREIRSQDVDFNKWWGPLRA
jgi:hypothetical protein